LKLIQKTLSLSVQCFFEIRKKKY